MFSPWESSHPCEKRYYHRDTRDFCDHTIVILPGVSELLHSTKKIFKIEVLILSMVHQEKKKSSSSLQEK